MHRRRTLLFAALLLACGARSTAPAKAPLPLSKPVQDKNFYLLSLIERTPPVARVMASDGELSKLRNRRRFTDDDIAAGADALKRLYDRSQNVRDMTDGPLRRSGAYVRYRAMSGRERLAAAWIDAARGIDNIIDVYAGGKQPRYPQIDAPSFDVKSVADTMERSLEEERFTLFFQPPQYYALELLALNNRDEAGRHEPLEHGENAGAIRRILTTNWSSFRYSVIVVPGFGPTQAGLRLAPEGRLRIEIAARRFRQGKAPFILLSGGYVHPAQTPYCEAIEMKKALISDYGVPADAIFIDPHARHTTTNLRNAARLIYRYDMPFDRKALITTDTDQSTYIESAGFAKRCDEELGYRPWILLRRINGFDLEFTPRIDSLQINAMDPLDP